MRNRRHKLHTRWDLSYLARTDPATPEADRLRLLEAELRRSAAHADTSFPKRFARPRLRATQPCTASGTRGSASRPRADYRSLLACPAGVQVVTLPAVRQLGVNYPSVAYRVHQPEPTPPGQTEDARPCSCPTQTCRNPLCPCLSRGRTQTGLLPPASFLRTKRTIGIIP